MNCSYDGGDCCGPSVNTHYCTDCQCCDASGCNETTTNEGKEMSGLTFLIYEVKWSFLGERGNLV